MAVGETTGVGGIDVSLGEAFGRVTVGRDRGVGASPKYSESDAFSSPGWKGVGEEIAAMGRLFAVAPHPEIKSETQTILVRVNRMM